MVKSERPHGWQVYNKTGVVFALYCFLLNIPVYSMALLEDIYE